MRLRRQGAILVLAFLLASPWLAAAEPRRETRSRVEPRVSGVSALLSHTWSFLKSILGATADCDAGPRADPLGSPEPTTDEGSRADPLG